MKKIMRTAAVAASFLAMATVANATEYNINLFGASAQFFYWNDAADNFLAAPVASNGLACADVKQDSTTSKDGIARGTNCAGLPSTSDVIYVRYSSRASADGPRSAFGIDPDNTDACSTLGYTDEFRKMADETSVDWNPSTVGGLNKCVDVTLGASDCASESFVQKTTGNEKGYLQTGVVSTFDMNAYPTPGEADGLVAHRPVVVPFAFFLNGEANGSTLDSATGTYMNGTGSVTNLSRVQSVNLMAGKVYNWSQFGAGFPAKKAVVCLRHAGSGTHATLDMAVMRGDMKLAMLEGWPTLFSPNKPYIYFHTGSSDLMACVNVNGSGKYPTATTTHMAVGYADADASAINPITGVYPYPKAVTLAYEGVMPTKVGITNGTYAFWSQQWIYENPADLNYGTLAPIQQKMMDFASDPANMPVGKQAVWAAASELKVTKASDTSLPVMN